VNSVPLLLAVVLIRSPILFGPLLGLEHQQGRTRVGSLAACRSWRLLGQHVIASSNRFAFRTGSVCNTSSRLSRIVLLDLHLDVLALDRRLRLPGVRVGGGGGWGGWGGGGDWPSSSCLGALIFLCIDRCRCDSWPRDLQGAGLVIGRLMPRPMPRCTVCELIRSVQRSWRA